MSLNWRPEYKMANSRTQKEHNQEIGMNILTLFDLSVRYYLQGYPELGRGSTILWWFIFLYGQFQSILAVGGRIGLKDCVEYLRSSCSHVHEGSQDKVIYQFRIRVINRHTLSSTSSGKVWTGRNKLRLNPCKVECLWMFGHPVP